MTSFGIIGMGKMGQAIATLLESEFKKEYHAFDRLTPENEAQLRSCEVAIEFTTPEASPGIIRHCISSGVPVVSGTTGWHEYHLDSIKKLCREMNGKFLYASNFSIGMNITFALNRKLAMIMEKYPQFKVHITEKHHIHKKDSPSGTAHSLIEDIIENNPRYLGFELNDKKNDQEKIPVTASREGEIKGYHEVAWNSGDEQILLSHEAYDRKIFAQGAILAAIWLRDKKPGVYTMRDIIHV